MVNANGIEHVSGCDLNHGRRQRCSTWAQMHEQQGISAKPFSSPTSAIARRASNPPAADTYGWARWFAHWQFASLVWSVFWFAALTGSVLTHAQWTNDWFVFVPLLAFLLGYAYLGLAAVLFALPLVIPAIRGDRTAGAGIAAFLANVTLLLCFYLCVALAISSAQSA